MNDELLSRLYRRHFDDPVAALLKFDVLLASVKLPFDLKAQIRELEYPPQPGFPNGFPSFIYYFVPNSKRGSDQPHPNDPLNPAFLNTADGIGLNLGCPVRLFNALEIMNNLASEDQKQPRDALRNARQHLSAVEELLWLAMWNSPSCIRRGGQFSGVRGDVDWALEARGHTIFLEAKFRQSDWPRLSEGESFLKIGDGFLSNAGHKFPEQPPAAALHLVGITTFDNITEEIVDLVGLELEKTPQIHAVIFRSLGQMTHVLSLHVAIRDRVLSLLAAPSITSFPLNYVIMSHREQSERRGSNRKRQQGWNRRSKAVCWPVKPEGVLPPAVPEDLYRLDIPTRGSDGEPHFRVIPKYLVASMP
jgi:hypothetical protein